MGENAGLFGRDVGRGLLIVMMIVAFTALLWRSALWLSRLAEQQKVADDQLLRRATELKAAVAESERHRAQLHEILDEHKRAAEQLALAKQAAEESNRAKDQFLAVLGHELRNPLSPIRNSVTLLKCLDHKDPVLLRAREIIDRQVAHMTRLIDDLLDVSRIARGKITLRKEEVEFSQVIASVVEDHRALFEANGVSLEFKDPGSSVYVYGDRARLTQIAGNLVMNANKFTDRGGRVTIELSLTSDRSAQLRVADTGIGMDAETLGKLFQPFAQADRSLDRTRGGLGIGLALVKGLVEMHGGKVTGSSAGPGRGSEFTVTLPAVLSKTEKAAGHNSGTIKTAPQKVLVVEDNLDAAETVGALLTVFGHEVQIAHNVPDALKRAESFRPDVVLCDIGLPGMSGYELAQAFRNSPTLRATYLIAMTGYGQEDDKRRALESGFDHHLTKPADPEVLERLLAR